MSADQPEARPAVGEASGPSGIDLYWLPLGAGGSFVRFNGRVYEALSAFFHRRPRCDLYHSALIVRLPEGSWVIESAPIRVSDGDERGVVGEGAVGSRRLGRWRIFRYELRCWQGGQIPDIAEAVGSPRRLSSAPEQVRALLAAVQVAPTPVWGRDELDAGEWWNSNSFIAWLLAGTGLDADAIHPPAGGRAPGWHAGVIVAGRAVGDPSSQLGRSDRAAPAGEAALR